MNPLNSKLMGWLGAIVTMLALLSFGLPSWAGRLVSVSNGYKLEGSCNLKPNEKYTIQKNGSNLQGGRADSSGCVKFTFRDSTGNRLSPGDNVVIRNSQGRGVDSVTVPKKRSSGGGYNNGGGNSGGNSDWERRQRQQREAERRAERERERQQAARQKEIQKARNMGENQARFFANKVVKIYGDIENYRVFLKRGLDSRLSNRTLFEQYRDSQIYRENFAAGETQGSEEGYNAGSNLSFSKGQEAGRSAAVSRFRNAANHGTQPNLEVPALTMSLSGLKSSKSAPSIKSVIQHYEPNMSTLLRQRTWGTYDGFIVTLSLLDLPTWTIYSIYSTNYTSDFVNSWYRAEWALRSWKNGTLTSQVTSEMRAYRSLSHSAKSYFDQQFRATYESVIDSKWYRKVMNSGTHHAIAGRADGERLGALVARRYLSQKGFVDGYNTSYSTASVSGLETNWDQGVESGFNQTVTNYSSSVILDSSQVSAYLVNSAGTTAAYPGASLGVVVNGLVNLGGGTGSLSVYVGNRNVGQLDIDYTHSKSAEALEISDVVSVSTSQDFGRYQVSLRIGQDISKNLSYEVTMESTLQALAELPDGSNDQSSLVSYVSTQINDEYDKNSSKGNGAFYSARRVNKTLLGQFVQHAQRNPAGRSAYLKVKSKVKRHVGSKPGFFASRSRSGWDNFQRALNKVK